MTKTSDDIMQEALDKYVVNTDHNEMKLAFLEYAKTLQAEIYDGIDEDDHQREKTDLQYDSLEASNHDFRLQDITN